ncbi:hypothetical protein [Ligilactobacillus equi]|nr:hypothetical protein [Ligilactobacillus equi]
MQTERQKDALIAALTLALYTKGKDGKFDKEEFDKYLDATLKNDILSYYDDIHSSTRKAKVEEYINALPKKEAQIGQDLKKTINFKYEAEFPDYVKYMSNLDIYSKKRTPKEDWNKPSSNGKFSPMQRMEHRFNVAYGRQISSAYLADMKSTLKDNHILYLAQKFERRYGQKLDNNWIQENIVDHINNKIPDDKIDTFTSDLKLSDDTLQKINSSTYTNYKKSDYQMYLMNNTEKKQAEITDESVFTLGENDLAVPIELFGNIQEEAKEKYYKDHPNEKPSNSDVLDGLGRSFWKNKIDELEIERSYHKAKDNHKIQEKVSNKKKKLPNKQQATYSQDIVAEDATNNIDGVDYTKSSNVKDSSKVNNYNNSFDNTPEYNNDELASLEENIPPAPENNNDYYYNIPLEDPNGQMQFDEFGYPINDNFVFDDNAPLPDLPNEDEIPPFEDIPPYDYEQTANSSDNSNKPTSRKSATNPTNEVTNADIKQKNENARKELANAKIRQDLLEELEKNEIIDKLWDKYRNSDVTLNSLLKQRNYDMQEATVLMAAYDRFNGKYTVGSLNDFADSRGEENKPLGLIESDYYKELEKQEETYKKNTFQTDVIDTILNDEFLNSVDISKDKEYFTDKLQEKFNDVLVYQTAKDLVDNKSISKASRNKFERTMEIVQRPKFEKFRELSAEYRMVTPGFLEQVDDVPLEHDEVVENNYNKLNAKIKKYEKENQINTEIGNKKTVQPKEDSFVNLFSDKNDLIINDYNLGKADKLIYTKKNFSQDNNTNLLKINRKINERSQDILKSIDNGAKVITNLKSIKALHEERPDLDLYYPKYDAKQKQYVGLVKYEETKPKSDNKITEITNNNPRIFNYTKEDLEFVDSNVSQGSRIIPQNDRFGVKVNDNKVSETTTNPKIPVYSRNKDASDKTKNNLSQLASGDIVIVNESNANIVRELRPDVKVLSPGAKKYNSEAKREVGPANGFVDHTPNINIPPAQLSQALQNASYDPNHVRAAQASNQYDNLQENNTIPVSSTEQFENVNDEFELQ